MDLDFDASYFWNLCKHGIGLTVLMFLLVIGWAFVLIVLIAIGSILGLIIGLGVYALALGYVNAYLADAVWKMSTDDGLVSRLFHGGLLFLVLLISEIPLLIINYFFQHWLIVAILFIIYVPIHGYIGIRVAEMFETRSYVQEQPTYWED